MPDLELETWRPTAASLGAVMNPLRIPYHVALKEAAIAAQFQKDYWEPAQGRPGLKRVEAKLPESTSDEILSLIRAVQAAHTDFLLIADPKVVDNGDRGRSVLDSLESVIEFLLDDGVHEPADDQLDTLKRFDADAGESSFALSQSLQNYAALAESLLPRLTEVDSGFNPELIKEAKEIAAKLSDQSPRGSNKPVEAQEAKLLRDQLLVLLMNRVNQVRSAARYVYAGQPEIVRRVTSGYERRRRAELRAKSNTES